MHTMCHKISSRIVLIYWKCSIRWYCFEMSCRQHLVSFFPKWKVLSLWAVGEITPVTGGFQLVYIFSALFGDWSSLISIFFCFGEQILMAVSLRFVTHQPFVGRGFVSERSSDKKLYDEFSICRMDSDFGSGTWTGWVAKAVFRKYHQNTEGTKGKN